MIIKIENGVPMGNAMTEDNFRYLFPDQSFPLVLTNAIVEPLGYAMYDFSQVPAAGSLQKTVEGTPVKNAFGIWRQQWSVVDLYGQELADRQAQIEAQRVASLWQSASATEHAEISGSAIGLITIGVVQGKPKCTAMQAWIKSLWSEYYLRKGNGSTNYDFSAYAMAPHTVPELMIELGV